MAKKKPAPQPYPKPDQIRIRGQPDLQPSPPESGLQLTPEERVRQEYLHVLIDEYGYYLDQIEEEAGNRPRHRRRPAPTS